MPLSLSREETVQARQEAGINGAEADEPIRKKRRALALRIFLTCWFLYALHFATNTVREIYPALSLGDHLSFDVSEYLGLHPDIFEVPGRGAFINNNPGASIMGAVPYVVFRPVIIRVTAAVQQIRLASGAEPPRYETVYPMAREFLDEAFRRGLDVKFGLAAGVMQVFLMAPLTALSVVVMFYVLAKLTRSTRAALWLALLYAFATPVFYRVAQLNHNLLESHFAFFAFVLLWRPAEKGQDQLRPYYFLAGLLAGWTVVLDYSGVIVVASLSVYAFMRWWSTPDSQRVIGDLLRFSGGLAISISLLMGYQWVNFGNPFLPAQHYMPATTFSGAGYQGLDWPQLDLLWLNSFGLRYGLYISAPILLLVFLPSAWRNRRMRLIGARETALVLYYSLGFLVFTAANQFSRMQFNTGVRHMVPVTPFLFLIAAGVLYRMPALFAGVLSVLGTYWSWSLAMYRDVELGLGIPDALFHITFEGFQLPWLKTLERMGYVAHGSVWPIFLLSGALLWLLWRLDLPSFSRRFFSRK